MVQQTSSDTLVLLDANPLANIATTRRIARVARRGRWLPRIVARAASIALGCLLGAWTLAEGAHARSGPVERGATTAAASTFAVVPRAPATMRPADSPVQVERPGLCGWHPWFCRYRGLYRQVGQPLLVLGAIALPCWLLFRLYRRRTSRRPPSARREILLLTFVVYLLGLAALTLTPNGSSRLRAESAPRFELRPNPTSLTCSSASLPSVGNARAFCKENALGNVLLFFPLGVLLPLVWGQLRFSRGLLIALALSFGIELVQYLSWGWGSHRSADVNDVVLNGLGASLGLAVASVLRRRRGSRSVVARA